jgi:hypothetical protein
VVIAQLEALYQDLAREGADRSTVLT